jgi:hypothetical protein
MSTSDQTTKTAKPTRAIDTSPRAQKSQRDPTEGFTASMLRRLLTQSAVNAPVKAHTISIREESAIWHAANLEAANSPITRGNKRTYLRLERV